MTRKQLSIFMVIVGTVINAWFWTAIAVNCTEKGYEFTADSLLLYKEDYELIINEMEGRLIDG